MKHILRWWKTDFLVCSKFYCWWVLICFWTSIFGIINFEVGIQAGSWLNWLLTWGRFGTRYFKSTAFSLDKFWQFKMSNTSYCWWIGFVVQKNKTLSWLPGNLVFSLGMLRETQEQASQDPLWKVTSTQMCGISPCSCKAESEAFVADCSSDGKQKIYWLFTLRSKAALQQ